MEFKNYQYNVDELVKKYTGAKEAFEQKYKDKDYDRELPVQVLAYLNSEPTAYLKYGVYFGPVLEALKSFQLLPDTTPNNQPQEMIDAYTCAGAEGIDGRLLTLTAALEFKEYYDATFFSGNRNFFPYGDETEYVLEDKEWESLATML
ncbi:hypothetical protein [Spirabiliibacterium falconis]|uniref:hypothetical protein n=1 Tax=Spirabiliibacterium falconis TaxID=572023 RepID=UPI001AACC422|nr:hypothetical protein [Spirabiliibacterium falconis]MBE2895263.1 hypothetical protein [Spirabiliibacterium falconis]